MRASSKFSNPLDYGVRVTILNPFFRVWDRSSDAKNIATDINQLAFSIFTALMHYDDF